MAILSDNTNHSQIILLIRRKTFDFILTNCEFLWKLLTASPPEIRSKYILDLRIHALEELI